MSENEFLRNEKAKERGVDFNKSIPKPKFAYGFCYKMNPTSITEYFYVVAESKANALYYVKSYCKGMYFHSTSPHCKIRCSDECQIGDVLGEYSRFLCHS